MTKHDNVSQGEIMKATEFVKKKGYKTAKLIVDCWCDYPETDVYLPDMMEYTFIAIAPTENCPFVSLCELKRLVESHELVESIGGLPAAKAHLNSVAERCVNGGLEAVREQYKILKQAIADVEACQ